MTTGIIKGTGYRARTAADKFRGAGTQQLLPLWRRQMTKFQWKRLSGTSVQSATWNPTPITTRSYALDGDPKYIKANTALGATQFNRGFLSGVMQGQGGAVMRQSGSTIITQQGGHGLTNENVVLAITLNQEESDIHWFEVVPSSDWATMQGPVGATYDAAGNVTNAGSIDMTTSYYYNAGTGVSPNFPRKSQGWHRDPTGAGRGTPTVGHTGYYQFFDDIRDRYVKWGQGSPIFGSGGSANIDLMSWVAKQFDAKNKNASEDPMNWTSAQPAWPNATLFFTAGFGDPTSGDVFRMSANDKFMRWRTATNDIITTGWPLYNNQSNVSFPSVAVPLVNKGFYFDAHNVGGVLQHTLRAFDLNNNLAAGASVIGEITGLTTQVYGSPQEGAIYHEALDRLIYVPINLDTYHLTSVNYTTGVATALTIAADPIAGSGPYRQQTSGVRTGSFRCGYSAELDVIWIVSACDNTDSNPAFRPTTDAAGTVWVADIT